MQPILNSDSFVDKPIMSLLSSVHALQTGRDTGIAIQDYDVHKKLEIIQVTAFIHAKLEETDKEREKSSRVS